MAPNNLYGAFVGVSEFVKLVEWAQYDWMAVENVTTSLNTSRLYLMVGKSLHKQFPREYLLHSQNMGLCMSDA